jgi:hypothetical protein
MQGTSVDYCISLADYFLGKFSFFLRNSSKPLLVFYEEEKNEMQKFPIAVLLHHRIGISFGD